MQSIKDIKLLFEQTEKEQWNALFSQFQTDERTGVKKIVEQYRRKLAAHEKEQLRLEKMLEFERKYGDRYTCICGIDEAGRGPFAGPVVAGAVVLPIGMKIEGLNDSKQVSAKRREELYEEIKEKALSYGIGMSSPARIDEINILQATYEAMRHALEDLQVVPDLLLNDAVTIPQVPIKQIGIVKGDARSLSIAAASIMAKVTRDRLMVEYAKLYPEYGFEKNKGYGSAEHRQALQKYGPCPIHRNTFIHNWVRKTNE
jgi:ribonuclease HII